MNSEGLTYLTMFVSTADQLVLEGNNGERNFVLQELYAIKPSSKAKCWIKKKMETQNLINFFLQDLLDICEEKIKYVEEAIKKVEVEKTELNIKMETILLKIKEVGEPKPEMI